MNIIKKYWDSVYLYVLLLVPGFCMCAGIFWTVCKLMGLYSHISWLQIALFDGSQLLYFAIAFFFIYQNKKDSSYLAAHLKYVKAFIVLILFIQYNFILYLYASVHVWECTFLFFAIIVFLFDSKLMLVNILLYFISLLASHILRPEKFLPLGQANLNEIIAFRIVIFVLTACCIMIIVYFVERFLMQARESDAENVLLLEKQLNYYKDLELMDRDIRKFRHDIKNHFICMETLIRNGDHDDLQQYFFELQQTFSFPKKIYFSGNDIIDAILHYELPHHCREDVTVSIHGSLPDIKTVSAMDLCTLFSNLLSNAIASANQCSGTLEPELSIRFSNGNKYFSIAMTNSILPQSSIKIRRKKNRDHGIGIRNMKDVLEKYNGRYDLNLQQQLLTITVYLPI